jgi:hypothetical protein
MSKRGALSKVEKFYIEGNADLSVAELAVTLDRTENAIQKHLDTLPETQPEQAAEVKESKTKSAETRFLQNMGRHERNGQKVATVMTRNASEEADRTRPQRMTNKKIQGAIHKPRS